MINDLPTQSRTNLDSLKFKNILHNSLKIALRFESREMADLILTANVQIMTANGIKGEIILWAMFSRRERL